MLSSADEIRNLVGVNPALASDIDRVVELLARSRTLLRGHFQLQSTRHSRYFLRFRHIGRERELAEQVAAWMVQLVDAPFLQGATLLAAESAGFFLAKAIARTNSLDTAIAKIDQRRLPTTELRSGPIGRKVVVVTDVVTTGSSVETLISLAQQNDATVSGVLTFGMLDPAAFTRLLSKHRLEGQWLVQASNWSTWDRSECPMCASDANDIVPAFELN